MFPRPPRSLPALLTTLLAFTSAPPLPAQPYEITTLAGRAAHGPDDGPVATARFYAPEAVVTATDGTAFVADTRNHTIRKISPDGRVSTVAGQPGLSGVTDGPAAAARFTFPSGLALLPNGDLLVADRGNHALRHISTRGTVSTWAGLAGVAGHADGPRLTARFKGPSALALCPDGSVAVLELGNRIIRRIELSGHVTTLAGSPGVYGTADGFGSAARFADFSSIVSDAASNVFVTDASTSGGSFPLFTFSVRRITPRGEVTTVRRQDPFDPAPTPASPVIDPTIPLVVLGGHLYSLQPHGTTLATSGHRIVRLDSAGRATAVAGANPTPAALDGPPATARFNSPVGLAADAHGNVFVADRDNHLVRQISPAGLVTTLAGRPGEAGAADGPAAQARFARPSGIAVDAQGVVFVSDTGNSAIRRIDRDGIVSTFAGAPPDSAINTRRGFRDGMGQAARFNAPAGIALDATGNLFVADTENNVIRKITPDGLVTTYHTAVSPFSIAVDRDGALYVRHQTHTSVLKIRPDHVEEALDVQIPGAAPASPNGIAVDSAGNLFIAVNNPYIAASGSTLLRRSVTGELVFLAGAGPGISTALARPAPPGSLLGHDWTTTGGEGVGSTARFSVPLSLASGPNGVVYISETSSHTIRRAVPVANPPRLTNCSVLATIENATDTVILGAKLGGGAGPKTVLARAAGPALQPFGVTATAADPQLELFHGATLAHHNDNWSGTATLRAAFARVDAFPYASPASRDAALLHDFSSGNISLHVRAQGPAATGRVLAELYDADGPTLEPARPRFTNISVLRTLSDELTVGFMLRGDGPKTLLIRAVGPTLGRDFGLEDAIDDPNLEVFDGHGRVVARNERWSNAMHSFMMLDAFRHAGAFPLMGDSLDAALLVTVPSGAYTAVLKPGIGRTTGPALLEVYEMP